MATDVREFPETPDYQSANAAIDMVLAQQSMKHKARVAKRDMREAKVEARLANSRVLARGAAYSARIDKTNDRAASATQSAENVSAAAARRNTLAERFYADRAKSAVEWQPDFETKYGHLSGAQREEAWTDFIDRRGRRLDSYTEFQRQETLMKSMQKRAEKQRRGFERGTYANERARSYFRGGKRQARQAASAYDEAVKAYNALNYVPWSP